MKYTKMSLGFKTCIAIVSLITFISCKKSDSSMTESHGPSVNNYLMIATGQTATYNADGEVVTGLKSSDIFYGQDANYLKGATMSFKDNSDKTVTDLNTGLMWAQSDGGEKVNWENALAYGENSTLGSYSDWRLPNVKELQCIEDYTKSSSATDAAKVGPAINSLSTCTPITNEAGASDYGYY